MLTSAFDVEEASKSNHKERAIIRQPGSVVLYFPMTVIQCSYLCANPVKSTAMIVACWKGFDNVQSE